MKKFEKWNVAFRPRKSNITLMEDTEAPFTVITNTWRYWCADPHLIDFNNQTYIFAELYDKILRRGVIGYCVINGDSTSCWTPVLRTPFHLSYPNIFQYDSDIYIIPESYVAGEISVYKATNFPIKWEKIKTLEDDIIAVDSTPVNADKTPYLLSYRFSDNIESLELLKFEDGNLQTCFTLEDTNNQLRPGGNFFKVNNVLYRPAQDCKNGYGSALNFYRVDEISNNTYTESLEKKITPDIINTDLNIAAEGIHTYNFNDKYEVIDIKGYEYDVFFYIMRPIWYIKRKLKNLFKGII